MKIKSIAISQLKFDPANARKHNARNLEAIRNSLKKFGQQKPLVVSKDNVVIAGNGTLAAAKELGWTSIDCVVTDLHGNAASAFAVADNRTAELAEWDDDGLAALLRSIAAEEDQELLMATGFDQVFFDRLRDPVEPQCDEDEVPENVETRCKPGDLWLLGNHRLLCGDSTNAQHVERLMNGERATLFATDPPYGINHVSVSQEKGQSKGYKKIANDELQNEQLQQFLFDAISTGIAAACDKNFAFYMWHAMKMQAYTAAAAAAAAAGILFHRQIIWVKPQFVFGRGHYHWRHELCLMGWLQGNEPPFYGERNQSSVWEIGRENDKIHPTQKPVRISEIPMENHTKSNQICYEPFAGSGGQIIAAEKLGRRCFALELEPAYCDAVIARFEKYTGKQAVLAVN